MNQYHIVGIGASAGGLEALEQFFDAMKPNSGMGFVIIQHLSPNYKSFMVELLSKHTMMTIVQAEEGMKVEPNSVYLIPPTSNMTISEGKLRLTDKTTRQGLNLPIDLFFHSLAADQGSKAIGIILSGTGSDGAKGIQAIKEAGGIVIVQDEASAKFDGMPKSAIFTGYVDHVMSPEEMTGHLDEYNHFKSEETEPAEYNKLVQVDIEDYIDPIYELILQSSGVDFSHYKKSSVFRRIERRMGLLNMTSVQAYYEMLKANPNEIAALRKDLLIGVTSFYRDPLAFEIIRERVIPAIFSGKSNGEEVRIWVAGCSTGEEAYSIAMMVRFYMENYEIDGIGMKIFATDLDKQSIETASQGTYPLNIARTIPEELLKRYFIREGDFYHICKEIRRMIVFAPHNITKDPPFSNLDLITCRNMLIYLQPDTQKKIISQFHFSLNEKGFLFLGPSETIGKLTHFFSDFDRRWNIFQQKGKHTTSFHNQELNGINAQVWEPRKKLAKVTRDYPFKKADHIYMTFVDEHMPPCLVIDEHHEIVHLSGAVNKYLTVGQGKPSWNIYRTVDMTLAVAIVAAMHKVYKEKKPVIYRELKIVGSESTQCVNVVIKPFSNKLKNYEKLALVLIEDVLPALPEKQEVEHMDITANVNERVLELEQELQRVEETLQATVEELETSNEELQATNEELVAANEELQSTNEELQSVNEELVTVNTEYQYKIQELTELNNDMDNFLVSTTIGTIFLDEKMCIRRFTPAATKEINLMDVDHGRPIGHISHHFKYDRLVKDARKVLKTLVSFEREVQSQSGKWYSLRIMPYRTSEQQVQGIVLTFVDITDLKMMNEELLKMSYAIQQSPGIIVITDIEGRIEYVNPRFTSLTGYTANDVLGRNVRFLNNWESSAPKFKGIWETLQKGKSWLGELEGRRKDGKTFWESVKMLPIKSKKGQTIHFLRMSEDISNRKNTEELLRKSEMLSALGQMAAGIAHEIRNPLTALKGFTKLIASGKQSDEYISIMSAELERIEHIVSELLILAKPQALNFVPKDVTTILQDVIMLIDTQAILNKVEIVTEIEGKLPPVQCVENQLKQVFINVLKNSIEAMPNGGKIFVKAISREMEGIILQFVDQGHGIPKRKLQKLGEPFYTTKAKGNGLGLMMSYKIIENHRGTISISSEEKKGTTVTIRLPTLQD